MGKCIRLDKFLADMQIGTRSQVKQYIAKGRVCVNEMVEKNANRKVDISLEKITFDDEVVSYSLFEYYMLNKPKGVVSATVDSYYSTVVDLIKEKNRKDLFPVGRLDIDTEGLLLITNDGELCHQLLSPKKHVDKKYYAKVIGKIEEIHVQQFLAGIDIHDEKITAPAKLEIVNYDLENATTDIIVTIQEGRYHQVKRMFDAIGHPVVYLKRLSMGSLNLDPKLKTGEYRALSAEELAALKKG